MKAALFLTTVLFCASINCFSQDSLKNSVFFELFGNGIYYSFNYERKLSNQFVARGGISYYNDAIVLPLTFGKFFGKKKHHFEITTGFDFENYGKVGDGRGNAILLTGFIGYRLQDPIKNFLFRVGLTPLAKIYDEAGEHGDIILSGGLSVGYRF